MLICVYPTPFLMEDYAVGKLFAENTVWSKLAAKIKTNPDLIEIVQPWLFGFCKR